MQKFIAHYTREIVKRLNESSSNSRKNVQASKSMSAALSNPSPSSENAARGLDVSVAERLNDRCFVFPDNEIDTLPSDWCVLSGLELNEQNNSDVFRLRGRLVGKLSPEEFVSKSYEFILGRKVDAGGKDAYVPLIERRQMTRRELFRILLLSKEFRERRHALIIIPEPSSWLSAAGINFRPDVVFTDLIVTL